MVKMYRSNWSKLQKKLMWYGCLTKQLGGKVVYHCTIFGWVSNMIWYWCYLSYHDCYVVSTISLCLTASQMYGTVVSLHNLGVNCVSLQFGSFMSIYTSVGKVVSLNNLGKYLCIAAIWRYGVLWYWWYIPWLVSTILRCLSATQG